MPYRFLDPSNGVPRDRAFWLVVTAVVAGQLLAFYLLCAHQVRQAEARRAAVDVQQTTGRGTPSGATARGGPEPAAAPVGLVSR